MAETECNGIIIISGDTEPEKQGKTSRFRLENTQSSMDFFKALNRVLSKILELEKYFRNDLEEIDYETFREEFG